jgi:hypothetical protein
LENAFPYCEDLHIDAGTKKLILNLLNSIRSVVPVVPPPEPGTPECDPGKANLDYIRNVLVLARKHSEELDGLFNPEELLRYTRYISYYQEIITQMEKILEELKSCRISAMQFASGLAELVEMHLQLTSNQADNNNEPYNKNITVDHKGIKLKVV